jgi:diguanylate cyclase (GGDEF)-like protein
MRTFTATGNAKRRHVLATVLVGAMLIAPAAFVWNRLGAVQSELPNYGFYLIRDLRFAFADVVALRRALPIIERSSPSSDDVRGALAEAADLLHIRFDQFRSSERSPVDDRFRGILDRATVVEDRLDRMLVSLPVSLDEMQGLSEDTDRLLNALSDYTQEVENATDNALTAQDARLTSLKLQISAGVALVSGLVGLVLLLLFQHVRKNREIQGALRQDALTGLANRRGFEDWVHRTAANGSGSDPLAIVVFDLDDFKPVNDRLGHVSGDALLKTAGDWLNQILGEDGIVARWGGDEFVAALRTDGSARCELAERLRAKLQDPPVFHAGGEQIPITFSAGAALWPADGKTHGDVIQHADLALYEAKDQGKGRLVLFDSSIAERRSRAERIRSGLGRALRENHLLLVWQPQIDVRSHRVVAAECLLRWLDPQTGTIVPPAEFIPVAEGSDLIIDVDCWVLHETCRTAARWMREGRPVRAAVNISPRHFQQPTLLAHVETALADHGLPPDWLEIEITEGVFLSDSPTVAANIEGLSRLGIRLALDDFGTGYSNIAYLTRLRPHLLKVDRSFLRDADIATRDKIIRSILRLGESIGAETLVEGVETPEDFRFLGAAGCALAQGYHFARPMPTREFEAWREAYHAVPVARPVRRKRAARG